MGDITRKAIIHAPVEAVFRYVSDPHNAPSYISSIARVVSGPQGAPAEGQVWRAEANFLGRRSTINLRLEEMRPHQSVRFGILGEPRATLSMRLTPDGVGQRTQLSLSLDAPSIPTILLNSFMGGLLEGDIARLKNVLERKT